MAMRTMAAPVRFFDRVGKQLGAFGIQANRRFDLRYVEDAQEAPNAGFAAILRPGNAQQVGRAGFE